MTRYRTLIGAIAGVSLGAFASAATAQPTFHPRVGGALGLVPPVNSQGFSVAQDVATGTLTPVTYHGGTVMAGGVTVHTIFWAPSGFAFQGSPGTGIPTYEGMIQQFFTDVAHDSGSTSNSFSVQPQYAEGTSAGHITAGDYSVAYNPATDSVNDTDAYPAAADQCASPNNATGACITDAQIQAEVDNVVQGTTGTPRGLQNIWYVFLPPNVDECITPGVCGTNAFGGYHSLSNLGNGVTVYAITPDPTIEATVHDGADPEGYPDAEAAVDVAAHETNEAMSDPTGVGYMDPNGFEVADKCEFGPQIGQPLGFAGPDAAPYNQLINGHKYLLQEEWSNADNGCVLRTTQTASPLPLPQVNLRQFSPVVSGNIGSNTSGVGVTVSLLRAGADGAPVTVAQASGTTSASGVWQVSLAPHAVGDDRDEIDVDYSGTGAPSPAHQVILTGNGGNPFTESGWTGWTAIDNGLAVTNGQNQGSVTMSPCFQTGVLQLTFNGTPTESPTDFCSTQTGAATVTTSGIAPGDVLVAASNDNRAFAAPDASTPNLVGGLVNLAVPVGEPDAVSTFQSPMEFFAPSGFPTCAADLEQQSVTCSGLVPGESYTLTDGTQTASGAAGDGGTLTKSLTLTGGQAVALSNGPRTLTTLHVAGLRVGVTGEQTTLSGGTCQPGDYYGAPLSSGPTSPGAGDPFGGVALAGEICPTSGDATGLPSDQIVQTDEASQGLTQTEVPSIEDTSPLEGETMAGAFTALAESGLPGPGNTVTPTDASSKIALGIFPAAGGTAKFTSTNVDTATGVAVPALTPGAYEAIWIVTDANGDTRTVTTRFIEQASGSTGPAGPTGPTGPQGPRGKTGPRAPKPKVTCKLHKHKVIKCKVTFPKKKTTGTVRMLIARGVRVAALGHSKVRHGTATVSLRGIGRLSRGSWTITMVLSRPGKQATTTKMAVRVR
jgi:hypothetical protein